MLLLAPATFDRCTATEEARGSTPWLAAVRRPGYPGNASAFAVRRVLYQTSDGANRPFRTLRPRSISDKYYSINDRISFKTFFDAYPIKSRLLMIRSATDYSPWPEAPRCLAFDRDTFYGSLAAVLAQASARRCGCVIADGIAAWARYLLRSRDASISTLDIGKIQVAVTLSRDRREKLMRSRAHSLLDLVSGRSCRWARDFET